MQKNDEWWWRYAQFLYFADGSIEANVHEKDIPTILSEHRRRIVGEIRSEIIEYTKEWGASDGYDVDSYSVRLGGILSLPCLKEE